LITIACMYIVVDLKVKGIECRGADRNLSHSPINHLSLTKVKLIKVVNIYILLKHNTT